MSKIFVIICKNSNSVPTPLDDFYRLCGEYDVGIFCGMDCDDPVCYGEALSDTFVLSLADSDVHNNCEMLLLPDYCSINGRTNTLPFVERAIVFQRIMAPLITSLGTVDVFVGESGTQLDEYVHYCVSLNEFAEVMMQMNSIHAPDLHITIKP